MHKPRHPEDFLCPHCGQPGPWASPEQVGAWTEQEAERVRAEKARDEARERYDALLSGMANGSSDQAVAAGLRQVAAATGYPADELTKRGLEAFSQYATLALADDLVTEEEDQHISAIVAALGLTWPQIERAYPALPVKLLVSEANAGLLPTMESSRLIPKRGEVVHLERPAQLMKEVTLREYQGGYRGFSFPIGHTGIRYRVGGARGHSVVVGTQVQVADSGTLSVSSARAVFIGARKTIEMPYSMLVSLSVLTDGVQFHQSNRQTAPLFKVPSGEAVAAVVNAAARRASMKS